MLKMVNRQMINYWEFLRICADLPVLHFLGTYAKMLHVAIKNLCIYANDAVLEFLHICANLSILEFLQTTDLDLFAIKYVNL